MTIKVAIHFLFWLWKVHLDQIDFYLARWAEGAPTPTLEMATYYVEDVVVFQAPLWIVIAGGFLTDLVFVTAIVWMCASRSQKHRQ